MSGGHHYHAVPMITGRKDLFPQSYLEWSRLQTSVSAFFPSRFPVVACSKIVRIHPRNAGRAG